MGRKKQQACQYDHLTLSSLGAQLAGRAGEEGGSCTGAPIPPPPCPASHWLPPKSLLTLSHPPNYTRPHIQRSTLGSFLPKCFPTQGSLPSSSLSTHMSTSEVSSVYFKLLELSAICLVWGEPRGLLTEENRIWKHGNGSLVPVLPRAPGLRDNRGTLPMADRENYPLG